MDEMQLETERLLLKPTTLSDAQHLLNIFHSPNWLKWIGDRNIHTIEEAEKYIKEKMIAQRERIGFSNFTVIVKSTNEKIGTCGLNDRQGIEGIDIGYAFLPEFEGFGYATEAAMRLKQAAEENFGLKKLSAFTVHNHEKSQNVLKKIGMHYEKNFFMENDPEELALFVWP